MRSAVFSTETENILDSPAWSVTASGVTLILMGASTRISLGLEVVAPGAGLLIVSFGEAPAEELLVPEIVIPVAVRLVTMSSVPSSNFAVAPAMK